MRRREIPAAGMKTQMYLTPADHGRALTLEEFTSARGQEGYWYEIIQGKLDVSPLPILPHDVVRDWLKRVLDRYAARHPDVINPVRGPACVFLPEDDEAVTAPEPHIACYRNFPVDLPIDEVDWRDFSPVLVVEVISKDTADKDLERNPDLYLQGPSIRKYWSTDTRESFGRPSMLVFWRRGARWTAVRAVPPGGEYTTPLLPEFRLVLTPRVCARPKRAPSKWFDRNAY
jgi:Uma2 family endonuclease